MSDIPFYNDEELEILRSFGVNTDEFPMGILGIDKAGRRRMRPGDIVIVETGRGPVGYVMTESGLLATEKIASPPMKEFVIRIPPSN